MPGTLALVGGDEFKPGNEEHDAALAAAAGAGPAFVVPTAAARMGPDIAVANAHHWFAQFHLDLEQLPVLTPSDARSERVAERAAAGGFFYLVGGDPGLVVRVLAGSIVWQSIVSAWRRGAALAGSSAGAMALGSWSLIRARYPGDSRRRPMDALDLVPKVAVLPHYNTFGHRWVASALEAAPSSGLLLLGIDERSAAIWDGTSWRASGPGAVTVIRRRGRRSFTRGDLISGVPQPKARQAGAQSSR